jgi:hypothetical protein
MESSETRTVFFTASLPFERNVVLDRWIEGSFIVGILLVLLLVIVVIFRSLVRYKLICQHPVGEIALESLVVQVPVDDPAYRYQ